MFHWKSPYAAAPCTSARGLGFGGSSGWLGVFVSRELGFGGSSGWLGVIVFRGTHTHTHTHTLFNSGHTTINERHASLPCLFMAKESPKRSLGGQHIQ